jgi:hypothetical protein
MSKRSCKLKTLLSIVVFVGVTSLNVLCFTFDRGTIATRVIDESGKPISGVTVQMLPTDQPNPTGVVRACLTDESGSCSQVLKLGKYYIVPMKQSEGYPDLSFNFYGHGKWKWRIAITRLKPNASETVRLGPKAATVILHATNALTGFHIQHVALMLRSASDEHDFLSTNLDQDSKFLIPPNEDVLVEVSADGYKAAKLLNQTAGGRTRGLFLRPGEIKEFHIALQPTFISP